MVRPLLHFFLFGAILFAGKVVFERPQAKPPEITVQIGAAVSDSEVEQEIRNQILLNEARRYGWYRTDPIVFTHLVRNMRFIEPETEDDDLTLFQRALDMNMQEHDPVVRARLLYRAREALGYVPEDRMPTREQLEAHRGAHPDRFRREGKVRFRHVFLSGTRRGDTLSADAANMRTTLDSLGDGAADGLGDPLPGLRTVESTTISNVEASYGGALAEVVAGDEVFGTWRGPVQSVYGLHFVNVLEKQPSTVPALVQIEAEVRADRLREIKKELGDERMEALRDAYVVHVERVP